MVMAPAETLGVLGGMGPAATAEFLRLMAKMAPARRDQEHPRIIVLSDPAIPDRLEAFLGKGEDPTARLRRGLESLTVWGADFLAVPCNTAHIFIDRFREELSLPLVHIVEATLKEAMGLSPDSAWLLATRGTCRSGLYGGWAEKWGYDLHVVREEVQVEVSKVIRLVKANRMEEATALLGRVLGSLWAERDVPVVLACTELPLAYDAGGFPAEKAVSSLTALATACLYRLYGDRAPSVPHERSPRTMSEKNDIYQEALELHRDKRGKIEVGCRVPLETAHDLSMAYTPGVAEPCRAIHEEPKQVWELTSRWNTVAVVSDGSAVLGLGDIGPEASLPVMEGKCNLFKRFAAIDAFPIILAERDVDRIVDAVAAIAPSFGGINLEDIGAPRCFEIEKKLQERLPIPVFHDDQHGTAVIVLAGLLNALRYVGKSLEEVRIVMNGIGAAGTAISRMIMACGAKNLICCDRFGVMDADDERLSWAQRQLARETNPEGVTGDLKEAMKGADVFVGVSRAGLVTADMVAGMASGAIVFAMANPTPEIFPDEARAAGAAVVATGRSDFPNQINNCLGFPGIFRGALDSGATRITEGMKLAAAHALAGLVSSEELSADYVIPSALDDRVVKAMAGAVAARAREEGVCRG